MMGFELGFNTLILTVIAFALYFTPAFVADKRKHKNRTSIYVLTLLLGWTGLGWIVALVWSLTDNCEATPVQDTTQQS